MTHDEVYQLCMVGKARPEVSPKDSGSSLQTPL